MKEPLHAKMIKVPWYNFLMVSKDLLLSRHLAKEDGKTGEWQMKLTKFMVIEFDRNEKRIVLSHTRIWEQAKAEEKDVARKEAKTESDKTRKAVKTIQSKVEKPTLGDLGALAEIKEKLQQEEKGNDDAKPNA